ncbi:hypothetical protein OH76DRAFT_508457 [Lentinus brumalis]|uniref:Uncharacterized protein n=1 Tax=Lentinus brumalis TaxID=2498619 RepID=A0A371DAZ9_9APHY|nr:hypothetical protein OH76DRAFT_508457 [Polyporus brumalis]
MSQRWEITPRAKTAGVSMHVLPRLTAQLTLAGLHWLPRSRTCHETVGLHSALLAIISTLPNVQPAFLTTDLR